MGTTFIPGPGDSGETPMERAIRSSSLLLGLAQSVENQGLKMKLGQAQLQAFAADTAIRQQQADAESALLPGQIALQGVQLEGAQLGVQEARRRSILAPILDRLAIEKEQVGLQQAKLGIDIGTTELEQNRFLQKVQQETYDAGSKAYDEQIANEPDEQKKRYLRVAKSSYLSKALQDSTTLTKMHQDMVNNNRVIDAQLAGMEQDRKAAEFVNNAKVMDAALADSKSFAILKSGNPNNPMLNAIETYMKANPTEDIFRDKEKTLLKISDQLWDTDPRTALALKLQAIGGKDLVDYLSTKIEQSDTTFTTDIYGQKTPSGVTRMSSQGVRGGDKLFELFRNMKINKDGTITSKVDATTQPSTQPVVSAATQPSTRPTTQPTPISIPNPDLPIDSGPVYTSVTQKFKNLKSTVR